MSYGHWGKVLRVNLTTGAIATEEMDQAFQQRYVGGWGFIAHYLLAELAPGIDPLGPENKLIWTTGPLTGQAVAGGGRNIIGGKSPLTGGFGAAEAGGFFAARVQARWVRYRHRRGRLAQARLSVDQVTGQAELRDASHLWGRETADVEAAIREELGDKRIRVSQCGPAGEKWCVSPS
jgi:aldehyde:ferredoxin oxidoreductase